MAQWPCPYLGGVVELTDERERHITESHPDLLPEYRDTLALTLANPDQVRRSLRLSHARLFSRWFDTVRGGKHIVVVVVSEAAPSKRHWIATAYIARRLSSGEVEWTRN